MKFKRNVTREAPLKSPWEGNFNLQVWVFSPWVSNLTLKLVFFFSKEETISINYWMEINITIGMNNDFLHKFSYKFIPFTSIYNQLLEGR